MELSTGIGDFLHYLRFEKRSSAHTVTAYSGDLEQFQDYLKTSYDVLESTASITHHHLRSWLASIREADPETRATTLNRKIATLSAFFRYAQRRSWIPANPVKLLHSLKRPERLPVAIQERQAEQLLEEIEFPLGFRGLTERLICELLYSTGMRRQELIGLRETDVHWDAAMIRVLGKGNKERLIPVAPALLDQLRGYLQEKDAMENADRKALLILESGAPLYAGFVYRTVNLYLSRVTTQDKRSPHVLRHSFATHLLDHGANIQAIRDLLGHSSLAATQVYTHSSIERLKAIHGELHPRGK
jgi:integrase/recombinase XerC